MFKLTIYTTDDNGKMTAVRQTIVHRSFCGVYGRGDYLTPDIAEFKRLADDIEPNLKNLRIAVTEL